MIHTTNTPVFTATNKLPTRMPAGLYGLLANGYQRPGPIASSVKDYVEGKNRVRATLTLNTNTLRMKHIAEGGSDTKLDQGGNESKYSGIYVPGNNAAIEAYLKAGRYKNLLKAEFITARAITIGVQMPQKIENDMLVVDGFRLYYYGNQSLSGIDDLESEPLSNEVEGYYNLNGVRLAQPVRGIIIVKYKDGHAEKILY